MGDKIIDYDFNCTQSMVGRCVALAVSFSVFQSGRSLILLYRLTVMLKSSLLYGIFSLHDPGLLGNSHNAERIPCYLCIPGFCSAYLPFAAAIETETEIHTHTHAHTHTHTYTHTHTHIQWNLTNLDIFMQNL